MQNYPHRFFKTRTNYYLYKLMDNHVPKGEQWKKMKKDIPPQEIAALLNLSVEKVRGVME